MKPVVLALAATACALTQRACAATELPTSISTVVSDDGDGGGRELSALGVRYSLSEHDDESMPILRFGDTGSGGGGGGGAVVLHPPEGLEPAIEQGFDIIRLNPGGALFGPGNYVATLGATLVPHWRRIPPGNHVVFGKGTNDWNVAESVDWGGIVLAGRDPFGSPAISFDVLNSPLEIPEPGTTALLATGIAAWTACRGVRRRA